LEVKTQWNGSDGKRIKRVRFTHWEPSCAWGTEQRWVEPHGPAKFPDKGVGGSGPTGYG